LFEEIIFEQIRFEEIIFEQILFEEIIFEQIMFEDIIFEQKSRGHCDGCSMPTSKSGRSHDTLFLHCIKKILSIGNVFFCVENDLMMPGFAWDAGLPDFSCHNLPKRETILEINIKSTKWPQKLPNGHKNYQMATKTTKWP
jgi:hypothetical protein